MAFDSAFCYELPPANSSITRFDGRYFHLDFPLNSIATIISDTAENLTVNCEFRSNRDLVGLLWTSADVTGHPLLSYLEDRNYTGVKIGFVSNPVTPYEFSFTASANGGALVYRMHPYMVQGNLLVPKVIDENLYGPGPGKFYRIVDIFPNGLPDLPEGHEYFILDFDDLRTGYNYEGVKIDAKTISQFFFSVTPPSYGLGPNARVANAGRIGYVGDGDISVSDTADVTHFHIVGVNPDLRLSKGDKLQITLVTPGEQKDNGKHSVSYEAVLQTILIQCDEWFGDGTTERYIKIANGPLEGAAWIGGRAQMSLFQKDTAIGNESVTFNMFNISVTGSRRSVGRRFYPAPAHNMQMTSGFDDTYNITPWRQVDNTYNLGYRGHFTIYMGMSHYPKAFSTGGISKFENKVIMDAIEPLNYPTEEWCKSLFTQMQAYGFVFIWSTSFEILNSYMPAEWAQRDYANNIGLSGWAPPSAFVIPSRVDAIDYLARVIKHGLRLLSDAGIDELIFQIGEPWWWDGSYTAGAPCIYDEYTRELYTAETGNPVPLPYIENYREPATPEQQPYLEWLGMKLGNATNYIRDTVKASYPDSKATLLFFTPQIFSGSGASIPGLPGGDTGHDSILSTVNFPIEQWKYPNYELMQIEDYDWIIDGKLELLPKTLEAAIDILKYPLEVVHYFVGFVLLRSSTWIWPNVNIATRDAILNGIPNIYVWAYPQVIRDGITYDDTLYGTDPAVLPFLERRRDVGNVITENVIRPVFFVQIGDDSFMNSSDRNIDFDGHTWFATGRLGKINDLVEGLNLSESGWSMSLAGIPADSVEYVTDNLRNKTAKMFLALVDEGHSLIAPPKLICSGEVISNDVQFNGPVASVAVNVKSGLADWHRLSAARYSDEYQQMKYPGDRGFRFAATLQNQKLNWGE